MNKQPLSTRSSIQDSDITLRSMPHNEIYMSNQQVYHRNLVTNEKQQFNLVLQEYKDTLNETISSQNRITGISNFTSILKQQPEICNSYNDPQLRMRHLNMLIVLQNLRQLTQQTIHHAVYLFDSYCSKRVLYKRHYTLLFLTCFLVSCKYNDKKSKLPTIDELVKLANTKESLSPRTESISQISNNNTSGPADEDEEIDAQMFHQMERHLLQTMNWSLAFWSIEESLQCICISLKQHLQNFSTMQMSASNHDLAYLSGISHQSYSEASTVENSLNENDLLLLYQTASFLGEVSHSIPDFNTLSSDVIGYVSILISGKMLEGRGIVGVHKLLVETETPMPTQQTNEEGPINPPNETMLFQGLATGENMEEKTPFYNLFNANRQVETPSPFPIKKLFTTREETIYKCLHLFLNLLFDIDSALNDKNRRYNIFLQKYSQIGIMPLIESFQNLNSKAYYKLIYLTNLEEQEGSTVTDSRLVRKQIVHVSNYFLGYI